LKHWTWRLNAPYLKLALKYGVVGPWRASFNASVVFDGYSLSRWSGGLPNSADLLITTLMNSQVKPWDVQRLEAWSAIPENLTALKTLRDTVRSVAGLHELSAEALKQIGNLIDRMIRDQENLKYFRGAKVFKWLSAWACWHIPMIDNELHQALTGYKPSYSDGQYEHASVLLSDYQQLLLRHFEQLEFLGRQLADDLDGLLPGPISPVRVLDSVLWFDWVGCYKPEFNGKWLGPRNEGEHEILEPGVNFLEQRGFTRTETATA
jgi:hypothetical protein